MHINSLINCQNFENVQIYTHTHAGVCLHSEREGYGHGGSHEEEAEAVVDVVGGREELVVDDGRHQETSSLNYAHS